MRAKRVIIDVNSQRMIRAMVGVGVALVSGLLVAATPPPQFTYQGRLMEIVNGVNTPVKNGTTNIFTVDMWVRLYSSAGDEKPSGALYGRKIRTVVNQGMFSIDIGDQYGEVLPAIYTNMLSLISGLSGSTLLVGVTPFVDTNDEIMPRQLLFSAPFTLLANDVSQALGDFTATNGTSLFQSLDVSGDTLFKGAVTNRGVVNIAGNVTFANGLKSSGTTRVKQLAIGGALTQSAGATTINGGLTVGSNATFQAGGLTIGGGATLNGNVTASSLDVLGDMEAGIVIATATNQITFASFAGFSDGILTVNGKAVFGAYFPDQKWDAPSRSDAETYLGSFTAPADGIYVISVFIRRDNKGTGSLTFTLMGNPIKPMMWANTGYGCTDNLITVMMKKDEEIKWSNEESQNTSETTRQVFQSFCGW